LVGTYLKFPRQIFLLNADMAIQDEVFHIPQAQAYCKGRWGHWDDKITTPPGLYVLGPVLRRYVSGAMVLT
jgi:hypothetical protein